MASSRVTTDRKVFHVNTRLRSSPAPIWRRLADFVWGGLVAGSERSGVTLFFPRVGGVAVAAFFPETGLVVAEKGEVPRRE